VNTTLVLDNKFLLNLEHESNWMKKKCMAYNEMEASFD